jgi:predicted phage baseplate assembly protein
VYRGGIGIAGNVGAGQITLATDKPLGVAGVVNPLRASGGAGPDRLEQARRNAPLAVTTLGRLVSVRDYADFARAFAGIGKATATRRRGAGGAGVAVTIAGIDDAPIAPDSDLFRNLLAALRRLGDPQLPLRLQVREALALTVRAQVALLPDYDWEDVAPRVRAALYAEHGFERREIGQAVVDSAIVATIQQVRGVAYALVQVRTYTLGELVAGLTPATPAGINRVGPGQIAWLTPNVPDTVILELLP